LLLSAAAVGLCGPQPADDDRPGYDEKLLREAGPTVSAEALAKFFTDRTPTGDPAAAEGLARQLRSDDFNERQKAAQALVALGPAAGSALLRALSDKDKEARLLATECFQKVLARHEPGVCVPAARALARLAPEKAPAVLLARLPYAWADEKEAIWAALSGAAAKGGRLDAAYAKALTDPLPARRALAGFISARYGGEKEKKAAAALLNDPDREVRLRVAQGLLGAGSTEGVPALIGLLSETPDPVSWQAEELLWWWAGEGGPKPGGDWAAWWKARPAVRPAKRAYRPRLLLVRETGINRPDRLSLWGCDGRRRWQIECGEGDRSHTQGFAYLSEPPMIVSAEWSEKIGKNGGEVVRGRDLKGRVLWERASSPGGLGFQRLAAGTVFTDAGELTPFGASVRLAGPWGPITRRLATGQLVWPYKVGGRRWLCRNITPGPGQYSLVEVDDKTGEKAPAPGTQSGRFAGGVPLGEGHCLLFEPGGKAAVEVDRRGRALWRAAFDKPVMGAARLPGGGVVVSYGRGVIEEVGPGGKVGWRVESARLPRALAACFPLVGLGF
jgi:hypothetical protein